MYKEVSRIVLTQDNIHKLVSWKEKNKDLVRNRKDVLKKGIIQMDESDIYFERDIFFMHFKYFVDKRNELELIFNLLTKQVKVLYEGTFIKMKIGKNLPDLIQDIIMIHSTIMAYMEHYKPNTVLVERKQQLNNKKKNKKKSKSTNKTICLKETIYKYDVIDTNNSLEKREYEKHTISWNVRGHWREYKKTGKMVWIKSYVKGTKDSNDLEGKEYKIK